MPTPAPTPRLMRDAFEVVTHPDLYHDQPGLRLNAWAALMNQRQRRVNQLRLCVMQHALRPATPRPTV